MIVFSFRWPSQCSCYVSATFSILHHKATIHTLEAENQVWKERARVSRNEQLQLEKERNEV
jgi:hypothetical protein